MQNTLYFILLLSIFGSFGTFAVKQHEKNENSIISQENKSKISINIKSANKDSTDVIDKEVPSINKLKGSINKNPKNEALISSNESIKTIIQSKEKETNIKDKELSTNQLLREKKEKHLKNPNKITPINKEEDEERKKWIQFNKETKKHKSKSIYKRQYDSLNEHLPKIMFTDDYSKQFFYCIKKGNLICLRGVINKLEKIGLTIEEILRFRNKLGDTPLIYAVKQGQIDTVRFLLLQGADPRVVNNNLKSPIEIAIEKKKINIINAITEMMPYLLSDKK